MVMYLFIRFFLGGGGRTNRGEKNIVYGSYSRNLSFGNLDFLFIFARLFTNCDCLWFFFIPCLWIQLNLFRCPIWAALKRPNLFVITF